MRIKFSELDLNLENNKFVATLVEQFQQIKSSKIEPRHMNRTHLNTVRGEVTRPVCVI